MPASTPIPRRSHGGSPAGTRTSSRSSASRWPTSRRLMGHEIALTIKRSRDAGEKLILILPVGPMGMYRWVVYFLSEWGISCDHVYGFNMDEWSDAAGNSLPANHPGSFEQAMEAAFYGPLGARHGAPRSAALRDQNRPAGIRRADRRTASAGSQAGGDLRHRPRVPHRVLGAALRRRVCERSGVEAADASPGREAASADDRAERAHQFQEPHDARAGVRQHDWPRTVSRRGQDHRRLRRHVRTRHDVAGA